MELIFWTDQGWHLTNNTATPLSSFMFFFPSFSGLVYNGGIKLLDFKCQNSVTVYGTVSSLKLLMEQEGKQNPEKETLSELLSDFPSLSTPHGDAREPYGDWQACYVSLSCQLASALGSFSLQWRDKSLLTCQATVNANWACYQCIIYRGSCRHFHRTGS